MILRNVITETSNSTSDSDSPTICFSKLLMKRDSSTGLVITPINSKTKKNSRSASDNFSQYGSVCEAGEDAISILFEIDMERPLGMGCSATVYPCVLK
jgi:hypothetical protein